MKTDLSPQQRTRRTLLAASLLVPAASWASNGAFKPNRAIKITVPQTPGTTPDMLARLLAPKLQEVLDTSFIVENKTGASGLIGMDAVAKANPDGYTLLSNVSTTLTLPFFYKNMPFKVLDDFTPIGLIGSGNFVLTVHQDLPVKNVPELVALIKQSPGKYNYASPGLGTHHHLCMELFQNHTGTQLVHIPYKGSAGATTDHVGGQIPVMFLPAQVAINQAKSGRIRILGGTLKNRHPSYPDIPSLHEQGLEGYDVDPWYALWAPAGLPASIQGSLNQALNTPLQDPGIQQELLKQGVIARPGTPDALLQVAKNEYQLWSRLFSQLNIDTAEPTKPAS